MCVFVCAQLMWAVLLCSGTPLARNNKGVMGLKGIMDFEVEACRKTAGSNFPFLCTQNKLLTSLPWFPF